MGFVLKIKVDLLVRPEVVEAHRAAGQGDGREPALADFCQVLLCLNEFVYVD